MAVTPFAQDFISAFQASAQRKAREEELDRQIEFENKKLGLLDAFRTSELSQRGEQFQQEQAFAQQREKRIAGQEQQRIGLATGQLGLGQERLAETTRSNIAQEALKERELGLRASIAKSQTTKTPDVSTQVGKISGALSAIGRLNPEDEGFEDARNSLKTILATQIPTMINKAKLTTEMEGVRTLMVPSPGGTGLGIDQAIDAINQDRIDQGIGQLTPEQIKVLKISAQAEQTAQRF